MYVGIALVCVYFVLTSPIIASLKLILIDKPLPEVVPLEKSHAVATEELGGNLSLDSGHEWEWRSRYDLT
jgi:hypothetical protein